MSQTDEDLRYSFSFFSSSSSFFFFYLSISSHLGLLTLIETSFLYVWEIYNPIRVAPCPWPGRSHTNTKTHTHGWCTHAGRRVCVCVSECVHVVSRECAAFEEDLRGDAGCFGPPYLQSFRPSPRTRGGAGQDAAASSEEEDWLFT